MDIEFPSEFIKAITEHGEIKSTVFLESKKWHRDKQIDHRHIVTEDLAIVREVAAKPEWAKLIEVRRIIRKLDALDKMGDVNDDTPVKALEHLAEAMTRVLAKTPRHWLFIEDEGPLVPWFVTLVEYHPPTPGRNGSPAHVDVDCHAMLRGTRQSKCLQFTPGSVTGGVTVREAFTRRSAMLATDELLAQFDEELRLYHEHAEKMGEQYLARGSGDLVTESRYRRDEVVFERDGEPCKVIMDDKLDRGKDSPVASMNHWVGKAKDDEDEGDATETVILPAHPIVRVFSLKTHEYIDTHVTNLEPYVYDTGLREKLVLPEETRGLIDALTGSVIEKMSDVVRGKAQGIIILCSGLPGTGKTLTAEVYSEVAQRPLYTVQCSQLGTNETQLEDKLGLVLEQATRWRAILLIDEADVYIHERGTDIQQNAIVGVFLRLLEYYNGILFMTTNRATVTDDAIMSRMTAHVRYTLPEGEDRNRLWKVLFAQYGIRAGDDFVAGAVKKFPDISGRSMRQLIRLALIVARARGEKFKLGDLGAAARFHDFTELAPPEPAAEAPMQRPRTVKQKQREQES